MTVEESKQWKLFLRKGYERRYERNRRNNPDRRKARIESMRRLRADPEYHEREKIYFRKYNRKRAEADTELQKRKAERELKRIQRKTEKERQKFTKVEIRSFYKWLHSQDAYRQKQKEKAREKARIYQRENRSKVNEYQKNRHRLNPAYRLRRNLRTGLRNALKQKKKSVRTMELIGCNAKELQAYLERTLPKGFTMQDFLDGKLHIDHIVPLAAFDQSDMNQVRIAWNWQNLQLLPAKINRLKHAKVQRPQLPLPMSF